MPEICRVRCLLFSAHKRQRVRLIWHRTSETAWHITKLDLNLFAANWYEGAQYQVPRDRVDDFELVADQHVD